MRSFDIPEHFRSPIISRVKARRKGLDARKLDFSPTELDFGTVKIQLARHFGFCFGVENAIEISYRAISENPGKRIYLLSQMIHNPEVNDDLESRGVKFLMDTLGNILTPISEVRSEDVVIIPAFGTTLEMEATLRAKGVNLKKYDTTCPFVERVWKRSTKLGKDNFTVVIHGKPQHEETRATFSHAAQSGMALIVENKDEALVLAGIIDGTKDVSHFSNEFYGRFSAGFNPEIHLQKLGVVNQTTMIASDTQEIAEILNAASKRSNSGQFANTRDTLCYATNDNQKATIGALEVGDADCAIVVGGNNSSNTTHIVEICDSKIPTFFIKNELELRDDGSISHYNIHSKMMVQTPSFIANLPEKPTILLTSGASCPDASMERVLKKLLDAFPGGNDVEYVLNNWESDFD